VSEDPYEEQQRTDGELKEQGCLGCLLFSVVSLGAWIFWRRKKLKMHRQKLEQDVARRRQLAGDRFDPKSWPIVDDLPNDDSVI
jgi:hypothetical protein